MVIISRLLLQATLASTVLAAAVVPENTPSLPKVDLGYEIHQAASYNSTAQVYNFYSIRYAAPPIGSLAFSPPQAPSSNRAAVQTGSAGRNCYGTYPAWVSQAESLLKKRDAAPAQSNPDGQDCLFLDVYTPKSTFDKKGKASVIVWIHGGGSVSGNREVEPWTLMGRRAGEVIVVAINYRLGVFGFLGGETMAAAGGGSNLGLKDQRFALEWVQKNIHFFGGDASRVTIMGESAGGDSVLLQMTAYGGTKLAPFSKAIPQSSSTLLFSCHDAEVSYTSFVAAAKCTNSDPKKALQCLRGKTGDELQEANKQVVGPAPYGFFGLGPLVDNDFVPDAVGVSLAKGHFAKDVKVMSGYNSNEGLIFADPSIRTDADFHKFLVGLLPSASNETISYVEQKLYPPPSTATPYSNNFNRTNLVIAELGYQCATPYLGHAHNNETYNYLFAVPPGWHSQDLAYTWYDGPNKDVLDPGVAEDLQNYITSFAIDGKPVTGRNGQPTFPQYGKNSQMLQLNNGGETVVPDAADNERCAYWQSATYLG